jgi:hypothetical protein
MLIMAKNLSNEVKKRFLLAKKLKQGRVNASSHCFIASVAQTW